MRNAADTDIPVFNDYDNDRLKILLMNYTVQ